MTFNWEEYYNLSFHLFNNCNSINVDKQAICRTAISRAYYASFCKIRRHLEKKEKIFLHTDSIHTELINKLKNINNNKKQGYNTISTELFELKKLRVLADYEDDMWQLDSKTKLALLRSKLILDKIKELEVI